MVQARPYRILIVDDHAIVREGVKQILADAPDIEVGGEADCAAKAIQLARQGGWDMVLLDISMPDRTGLETLDILRAEFPKLQVLMFSMYLETQYAVRALKSGAAGYLNKQSSPAQMIEAIRAVAAGRKYVSPEVAQALVLEVAGESNAQPHESLSNREFQTLCLIASGMPVSAIADKLALSVKTVSMYRARLLEKMKMKNNAELTHYAIKNKLVE